MTDLSKLKKGISIGFFGGLSKEAFQSCKKNNIGCVEISSSYNDYIEKYNYLSKAAEYSKMAADAGVEIWSLHLPFGRELDISSLDEKIREFTINTNKDLISAAASAGIKMVVMHPSAEPISEQERPLQFEFSKKNILLISKFCQSLSVTLAVENLPRTCLCNTGAETVKLLSDTGAVLCFDTNHSLIESNGDFLRKIISGGIKIGTLHISDYDFIDERHRVPGDGVVNWKEVCNLLEEADYNGPLMYEISRQTKDREPVTDEQLVENQRQLALKLI